MEKTKIKLTVLEKIDKLIDQDWNIIASMLGKTKTKAFKKALLELCKEEYIDGSNACYEATTI